MDIDCNSNVMWNEQFGYHHQSENDVSTCVNSMVEIIEIMEEANKLMNGESQEQTTTTSEVLTEQEENNKALTKAEGGTATDVSEKDQNSFPHAPDPPLADEDLFVYTEVVIDHGDGDCKQNGGNSENDRKSECNDQTSLIMEINPPSTNDITDQNSEAEESNESYLSASSFLSNLLDHSVPDTQNTGVMNSEVNIESEVRECLEELLEKVLPENYQEGGETSKSAAESSFPEASSPVSKMDEERRKSIFEEKPPVDGLRFLLKSCQLSLASPPPAVTPGRNLDAKGEKKDEKPALEETPKPAEKVDLLRLIPLLCKRKTSVPKAEETVEKKGNDCGGCEVSEGPSSPDKSVQLSPRRAEDKCDSNTLEENKGSGQEDVRETPTGSPTDVIKLKQLPKFHLGRRDPKTQKDSKPKRKSVAEEAAIEIEEVEVQVEEEVEQSGPPKIRKQASITSYFSRSSSLSGESIASGGRKNDALRRSPRIDPQSQQSPVRGSKKAILTAVGLASVEVKSKTSPLRQSPKSGKKKKSNQAKKKPSTPSRVETDSGDDEDKQSNPEDGAPIPKEHQDKKSGKLGTPTANSTEMGNYDETPRSAKKSKSKRLSKTSTPSGVKSDSENGPDENEYTEESEFQDENMLQELSSPKVGNFCHKIMKRPFICLSKVAMQVSLSTKANPVNQESRKRRLQEPSSPSSPVISKKKSKLSENQKKSSKTDLAHAEPEPQVRQTRRSNGNMKTKNGSKEDDDDEDLFYTVPKKKKGKEEDGEGDNLFYTVPQKEVKQEDDEGDNLFYTVPKKKKDKLGHNTVAKKKDKKEGDDDDNLFYTVPKKKGKQEQDDDEGDNLFYSVPKKKKGKQGNKTVPKKKDKKEGDDDDNLFYTVPKKKEDKKEEDDDDNLFYTVPKKKKDKKEEDDDDNLFYTVPKKKKGKQEQDDDEGDNSFNSVPKRKEEQEDDKKVPKKRKSSTKPPTDDEKTDLVTRFKLKDVSIPLTRCDSLADERKNKVTKAKRKGDAKVKPKPKEKPFECKYCGKAFKHHASLNFHEKWHTSPLIYECRFCEKKFPVLSGFEAHVKIVHADMLGGGNQKKQK